MDDDDRIAELGRRLARAVAAENFEEAARLGAEIDRLAGLEPGARRGPSLVRGSPGRMGLGTDQPVVKRPEGWTPPPRPDLGARTAPRRGRPKGAR